MTFNNYSSYSYLENIITEDLSIVAVIDCDNVVSSFYASEELIDDFISKISLPSYSEVVFSLPSSLEAKGHLLEKLYDEGYEIGEGVELDSFTIELVEEVGPVLIYISIFIGIFAFLIIYNFISNSVKIRRKEVGVLRSMGARNSDVIKIFGTEIIIMSIIIYGFSLYSVIDSLSAINSLFNNLVSISIFKGIIIYVVCILFLSIASFLPLYKLLKKNPIDAIRKVF
jgi:ABC-type antimicrobial peptide transport system permease subunit